MGIPVGINGFGRIGRIALRIMLERGEKFELRGINLRKADLDYMEYMVKYDSVFRTFHGTVEHDGENLIVNGHKICVFSQSDAGEIPWSDCGAEYIIESTGAFNTQELGSGPHRRRRQEGGHVRPLQGRHPHVRHGRQPRDL